jgi:hypothetical protein
VKRIKFSLLKKEWEELIKDLNDDNQILRQLLGDSKDLAYGRTRRNIEIPKSWKEMRERASSLLNAMTPTWVCPHEAVHCANLLMEDWGSEDHTVEAYGRKHSDFRLWFSVSDTDADCQSSGLHWDWVHAEVTTIPPQSEKKISPSTEISDSNAIAEPDHRPVLKATNPFKIGNIFNRQK